jgi:nicotinamide-nucleotide amidase
VQAEIIAVGSELLTPNRVDTNSLYLTEQLNNLGVEVIAKSVIGDDRDRLAAAVRRSIDRAEIVVLTGGLGPTEDDVTRDAVALALDRKQEFHPEIKDAIEERFRRFGRRMAEINLRQAFVIEGAEALSNDRGTAPGQWVEESGRYLMLLPGPPNELKGMFERHCFPRLSRAVPRKVIRTLVFRVAGMGESDLDQLIAPVYKRYINPVTTVLAAPGDVQVHLRAQCEFEEEAAALLNEVGSQIELLLGEKIYSRNGDPLEEAVGALLRKAGATLAVAESCTGGLLSERLTSVAGSSDYFLGGLVTYTAALKAEMLGVPAEILATYGAVSRETAEAMAAGVRQRTGATYALSVTGLAGPGAGGEKAPVGSVYIGIADAVGCRAIHRQFPAGDRARVRQFAAQTALDQLRLRLSA